MLFQMGEEKHIIVAPVGEEKDAFYTGIEKFPPSKVILLSSQQNMPVAEEIKKDLDSKNIPTKILEIGEPLWEEMFKVVRGVSKVEDPTKILVNIGSSDRITQCAVTSAAFVNGLRAFNVNGDRIALLPILRFSYYDVLTDRKRRILEAIGDSGCSSLEELSKKASLSLPLISYHINGNMKSEGLKQLGLVETEEKKGRTEIRLTLLGRLIVSGLITVPEKSAKPFNPAF